MTKHARLTLNHLSLAAFALAITAAAGSAVAASVNASSTSVVVTPIAIAKSADLSFGAFAASGSSGTVTVLPDGSRSVSGGVTAAGGTPTAARFDVTGSGGLNYSISLTNTTLTSGGDSMSFTVNSDTTASTSTSSVTSGTLSGGGTQSIFVGGVLSVGASQAAGTYTGSITATVEYQ